MKLNIFHICAVLTLIFSGIIFAQAPGMRTITLDEDTKDFANPFELVVAVAPGDSIQFVANTGNFAILIEDAYQIIDKDFDKPDLNILLDDTTRTSEAYKLRTPIADVHKEYMIYCISNDEWIEAPPKIVLIVRD